ncbi:hypothetical protein CEXT_458171 [Caerostris extrusa]|uniref:Uncharacterized protein n=1 Tax=Caerostris extrusa TaxID=172846 RepID=A0AAV4PUS1_CAEEX|nr:hypothetical protein CEXT_458171 [Caerostris extrusa]
MKQAGTSITFQISLRQIEFHVQSREDYKNPGARNVVLSDTYVNIMNPLLTKWIQLRLKRGGCEAPPLPICRLEGACFQIAKCHQ